MDSIWLRRIAIALAALCVLLDIVKMFVPFNSYGVDMLVLAGAMAAMAFSFRRSDNKTMFIIFLALALVEAAMGAMNAAGVLK